jgi:hypothetical protein
MIEKRSRYEKVGTVELREPNGEASRLIALRPIRRVESVFSHLPRADDRLDRLAAQHYRDPTQFFRICDASDTLDPFDVIEPGVPLPIPPQR